MHVLAPSDLTPTALSVVAEAFPEHMAQTPVCVCVKV